MLILFMCIERGYTEYETVLTRGPYGMLYQILFPSHDTKKKKMCDFSLPFFSFDEQEKYSILVYQVVGQLLKERERETHVLSISLSYFACI
jgi:hypothetical protein